MPSTAATGASAPSRPRSSDVSNKAMPSSAASVSAVATTLAITGARAANSLDRSTISAASTHASERDHPVGSAKQHGDAHRGDTERPAGQPGQQGPRRGDLLPGPGLVHLARQLREFGRSEGQLRSG